MSNNLKIQVLLEAVDNASQPFKAIENASKNLAAEVLQTQESIAALEGQLGQISRFRQTNTELATTRQQLKAAKDDAAALAVAFKNSERPTLQQGQALDKARQAASALQTQSSALRLSIQQQRQELLAAGIAPRNLSREQMRLQQASIQATSSLASQQQALQRLNTQQDQLNQTRDRYRKGQALADKVRNVSASAFGMAKGGVERASSLLRPGYDFAEANSKLQSTLGLDKNAPQLQALKNQARSLSRDGAISPTDVVQTQIKLAQSGSSAEEILAKTPAALPTTQANPALQSANSRNLSAALKPQADAPAVKMDSLGGDINALQAASGSIGIDLYDKLDGSLRTLTQDAAQFLLQVDSWIQQNPVLASGLAQAALASVAFLGALGVIGQVVAPLITGVNLLIAGAGFLGTTFSVVGGAIATVLGGLTLPIVAVIAAVVAGALIIRQYWEPISAFIGGVAQGFVAAMGPIANAFAPLQPVFSWIGDKLKVLWDWFGKLLEPVKLTQSELASAGEMGQKFGAMLANALMIPGKALDQLRGGIDWVLQKLGIIDNKSDKLKDKVPSPNAIATGGAGVDAGDMQYNVAQGGAPLRPITAPTAAGGFNDHSQNSYQYEINMQPGMSTNDVRAMIDQHQAEQQRQRWANQYSLMGTEN